MLEIGFRYESNSKISVNFFSSKSLIFRLSLKNRQTFLYVYTVIELSQHISFTASSANRRILGTLNTTAMFLVCVRFCCIQIR
jgi:hypothetical protein